MDRPSSFSKRDFGLLVAKYQDILDALRTAHHAASQQLSASKDQEEPTDQAGQESLCSFSKKGSSAAIIHDIWKSESSPALDGTLATTPLGEKGARAIYWVHQDNITNVQILVLRHASQRKSGDNTSVRSSRSSAGSSPKCRDGCTPQNRETEGVENYSLVVCDKLERFAKQSNGETIGDLEKSLGSASERAAASIRFSRNEEIFVTIKIGTEKAAENITGNFLQSKLKRKNLRDVCDLTAKDRASMLSNAKLSWLAKWYSDHPEVKPLVQITSYRINYEGLKNSAMGGIWVTLDNGILIRPCSESLLAREKPCLTLNKASLEGAQRFPHAVLEVRVEGNGSTQLIEALDRSHLVFDP